MKVIVAGSREGFTYEEVDDAILASGFVVTEVVSGGAACVDHHGELWAQLHGVPWHRMPADWNRHGRSAGPIRNSGMGEYGDALVVLIKDNSSGSSDMLRKMQKLGKPVFVRRKFSSKQEGA